MGEDQKSAKVRYFSFSVFAATGDADTYTVTMKKVELCTSSACSSPTVVASGSQAVDIASLSAGSDAASFGSTTTIGVTGTTGPLENNDCRNGGDIPKCNWKI